MKNILVPCDFSKPSIEAFKFAVKIASQNDGEVHVLNVIDITFLNGNSTVSSSYVFTSNFLKDIEKKAEHDYQNMWEKYAPLTMRVRFRHVISSLTTEIEKYILANKIDLVVMGTHGEGNSPFGSNTKKIVRISPVPVLAIRTAPEHVKNILVAVSRDHFNDHFIQSVKDLQAFFKATLHLVYINTPTLFQSDSESFALLKAFVERGQFGDYTISVRSDLSVESGLVAFSKEVNADLIAMGTHAWKGLTHYFVGSTAENMVGDIKVPIWTLHLSTTE